jgi:hypothetical protein
VFEDVGGEVWTISEELVHDEKPRRRKCDPNLGLIDVKGKRSNLRDDREHVRKCGPMRKKVTSGNGNVVAVAEEGGRGANRMGDQPQYRIKRQDDDDHGSRAPLLDTAISREGSIFLAVDHNKVPPSTAKSFTNSSKASVNFHLPKDPVDVLAGHRGEGSPLVKADDARIDLAVDDKLDGLGFEVQDVVSDGTPFQSA